MTMLISERVIKQAMDDDNFDCSVGKGRPLKLLESAYTDPTWCISFHILKNADMRPLWLEMDLEFRRTLQEARKDLANAARSYGTEGPIWENFVLRFVKVIEEVNGLIQELNLKVPHSRFQRVLLDPEREIHKVLVISQMESS